MTKNQSAPRATANRGGFKLYFYFKNASMWLSRKKSVSINILLVCLCVVATPALAEQPLTVASVTNMQKVIRGFEALEHQVSALSDGDEGASPLTPEGRATIIATIKASPHHAAALQLVKANGFESLEGFFEFAGRVSSASIAYGLETNGVGEMNTDMRGYLEELKQQGVPPEMLAQIQNEMAAALAMTNDMNAAAKAARPADVAALRSHPEILRILEMD